MQTDKSGTYGLRIAVNEQRLAASKQLFMAAVLSGEDDTAERYRLEIHTLLDTILDDSYSAMRDIRQQTGKK